MKQVLSVLLALLISAPFAGAKTQKNRSHSRRPAPRPRAVYCPAYTTKYQRAPFSTLIIDAGHGGWDRGGIASNLVSEKAAALDVALRLNGALKRAGFQTILTRKDDTFVPLDTRAAISNSHPGAVFISIHFDACPRRDPSGVDAHYYSSDSIPLASMILKRMVNSTHCDNRGVKRNRYRVLRNNRNRAVLVECGFLTNPRQAALVRNASYRQRIAEQICAGVLDYRRSL
jgi:N-acetylmuramoyl-L-alanine amidase